MSKLIYMTNTSLDGYIEDDAGGFGWSNPDGVFDFITASLQTVGTHLYGRRLYETMAYWAAPVESYPAEQRDFARLWQKSEKIVFSRGLTIAASGNTRIEREFDVEAIRKLKDESHADMIVGGAELAAQAIEANLVDECQLFLHPVIVGSGKPAFRSAVRGNLELLETRRFSTGVVHVRYRMPAS